jgi:hypothetical protein
LPVLQVIDEDIPDRTACNTMPVDQLGWTQLPGAAERPDRRRGIRPEHAHCVGQLVEAHSAVLPERSTVDGDRQFQAVPDGDVAQGATFDGEDRRRRRNAAAFIVRPAAEPSHNAASVISSGMHRGIRFTSRGRYNPTRSLRNGSIGL